MQTTTMLELRVALDKAIHALGAAAEVAQASHPDRDMGQALAEEIDSIADDVEELRNREPAP
jgi:hypothetical protein